MCVCVCVCVCIDIMFLVGSRADWRAEQGAASLTANCPLSSFGLYKILVYLFVCARMNEPSLGYPRPFALPTLLQYYCATFAQYVTSPRPSLHMPYTIHYW